jgi:SNF2 family DNA or RNA helicase
LKFLFFQKDRSILKIKNGDIITVPRNDEAEIRFTALLLKQHPDFIEQLDDPQPHFYLHKERFLQEDWFLNAFEEWQRHDISILGFNELKGNRLNQNKAVVSIKVLSGINWFNTVINVRFGNKTASLKQLHKSILHKNKYVLLDDGTLGILPVEWVDKLSSYFQSGEITGEVLQIPKINFSTVSTLFSEEVLDNTVKKELANYQSKLADFESIAEVAVPEALNATLRHYQQQGLNWLNFLDDFNFGGCLADDMGLGKTVQIIAFILHLRNKVQHNTNLLVVPTSVIYNWQEELKKFAPSIKLHTIYGSNRLKNSKDFGQFEIILTSYGTMLSDIRILKEYEFNYIFLDESQNIKNPESQRYQAARLLRSRNKITITGTPVENNSFDLFGQLSFACPGLLGNKQYFRDTYSTPVDRFKDSKRATELQQKINPFILRRTKMQVASELPDKTEMRIYCEMGEKQRRTYDAYEKELRDFISGQDEDYIYKNPMHVLKGLTKLRQICNAPLLLKDEKLFGDESCKIDVLIDQIESKKGHHKMLVFSQFVSMLNLIRKELDARNIKYEYLTGSTVNRPAVIKSFQENKDIPVFLISLKAGGTGLNLTSADYVFLVDPWWNPAVENQAIDRCYRIGQEKHVVAVRLICPDTIEDKIMKLQETKREIAEELVKTDGSILKSLSKSGILSMLRPLLPQSNVLNPPLQPED